jgi:hypothetical protein
LQQKGSNIVGPTKVLNLRSIRTTGLFALLSSFLLYLDLEKEEKRQQQHEISMNYLHHPFSLLWLFEAAI